jgi:hypothetical protein
VLRVVPLGALMNSEMDADTVDAHTSQIYLVLYYFPCGRKFTDTNSALTEEKNA